MIPKILFIDDDASILAAYQRSLRKQYSIDIALGGEAALATIADRGPYAVIVADMQMPRMNGVQFLTKAEALAPDTVRIMLTGNSDQRTATEAVNQGHVFRFLNKPCSPEALALALKAGVRQYDLVTAERELLENTLNGSVKLLTDILSMVDPESFGQAKKLREYMRIYIQPMHSASPWEFEIAAMLSPIGLVTVPPTLLYKIREGHDLTAAEKEILARAPETGSDLLSNIPRLEPIARIIRFQNKHYDGSGSPNEFLAGGDLPIASRILKVLFDLLHLEREGKSRPEALAEMRDRTGWYDPEVLDAAFVRFDINFSSTQEVVRVNRTITLQELTVKQILRSGLFTCDGTLIAPEGTEISQLLLAKIHNFHELVGVQEPIHVLAEENQCRPASASLTNV
jgi:response regulator RpfG family c-di-GMP phosphodiesterase